MNVNWQKTTSNMEPINKSDIQSLEKKIEVTSLHIEEVEGKIEAATVGDCMPLMDRLNSLTLKRLTLIDTLNRLCDKNFTKIAPERSITIPVLNLNRYAR